MLSSKKTNFQFHLSWVCRYWRRIIFENSNFWTTLSFRLQGIDHSEYMELVVRNSGSKELVLLSPQADDDQSLFPNCTMFYEFLQHHPNRIKALLLDYFLSNFDGDGEWTPLERLFRLPNVVFENLQILSMLYDGIPNDFLEGIPNLQAFQLTSNKDLLPEQISRLPCHLKKLSLSLPSANGIPELLSHLKELEFLSMLFDPDSHAMPVRQKRIHLPHLTTLITNGPGRLMEVLDAPSLEYLEMTATTKYYMEKRRNKYALLDNLDLSMFTHLYIGYMPARFDPDCSLGEWQNPVEGCIWATVGPADIPCLTGQPSIYRCADLELTEFPSSWSVFSSDDGPEFLIHIHTNNAYAFTEDNIRLPLKLFWGMTSLETLVLILPDTPYPPSHHDWNVLPQKLLPKAYYEFHLDKLFRDIAQPDTDLLHLVIRIGLLRREDIDMLSDCFDEELWSSDSCPSLESITFQVYSYGTVRRAFWSLWINFLSFLREAGRPLKLLRLIDCPRPTTETLSKLEELSDVTKVSMEESDDAAFHYVHLPRRDSKCYPTRGF